MCVSLLKVFWGKKILKCEDWQIISDFIVMVSPGPNTNRKECRISLKKKHKKKQKNPSTLLSSKDSVFLHL